MSAYFKTSFESNEGIEGEFYFEVENGKVVRHISVFDGFYYWETPGEYFDDEYDFTDKPEFPEPTDIDFPVTEQEFKEKWDFAG